MAWRGGVGRANIATLCNFHNDWLEDHPVEARPLDSLSRTSSHRWDRRNGEEHEFEFVGMEDWRFMAVTCRERLLAENHAPRDELAGRERPARYSPDFTPIERAHGFIKRKGTDICLDFHCECGADGHFHGDFAYALRCAECGRVCRCPTASRWSGLYNGIVKDLPKEYNDQWMNNTLCYVCNKPSTYETSEFIT